MVCSVVASGRGDSTFGRAVNPIGQPFGLYPTAVFLGYSLQSLAFRRQLVGPPGFGWLERSHPFRDCGCPEQWPRHARITHEPRRYCDFRDADSPANIGPLPSLEAAGDALGPPQWSYSSNVSFERHIDCGENQENPHGRPQKREWQAQLRPNSDASSADSTSVGPCPPPVEPAGAI
jgi:hypothetical protein